MRRIGWFEVLSVNSMAEVTEEASTFWKVCNVRINHLYTDDDDDKRGKHRQACCCYRAACVVRNEIKRVISAWTSAFTAEVLFVHCHGFGL